MAKVICTTNFVGSNDGVHLSFATGTKMCVVPAMLSFNDEEEKSCTTIAYESDKGRLYANSFCVVINDGTKLSAYTLPATTVTGVFKNAQQFDCGGEIVKTISPRATPKFANSKLFVGRKIPTQPFELVASATAETNRNNKKGEAISWTLWGVREIDDKVTIEGGTISWGALSLSQTEYDTAIADIVSGK